MPNDNKVYVIPGIIAACLGLLVAVNLLFMRQMSQTKAIAEKKTHLPVTAQSLAPIPSTPAKEISQLPEPAAVEPEKVPTSNNDSQVEKIYESPLQNDNLIVQ